MLGREAYHNPYLLSEVDSLIYGESAPAITREQFLDKIEPYLLEQLALGCSMHGLVRHLLGLYQGQPGARIWRRVLSEESVKDGAGIEVLHQAREELERTARHVATYHAAS